MVVSPDRESSVEPILLTVFDVCKMLNISRSTLLRLEKAGTLLGRIKLGGQVRYVRSEIDKWVMDKISSNDTLEG
jgi:excisionase family DNA binding protein